MPRKREWTKEFVKLAEGDGSPEASTGQILALIAERDQLKRAAEEAKDWIKGDMEGAREAGVLVFPKAYRELLAQLQTAIKNAKS